MSSRPPGWVRGGRPAGSVNKSPTTASTRGRAASGRGRGRGRGGASASASASASTPASRLSGRGTGTTTTAAKKNASDGRRVETVEISDNDGRPVGDEDAGEEEEEEEEEEDEDDGEELKTIPPELLTRLLHEFFEDEGTRITRDANDAVAKYVDVFVREAIARAAVEREGAGGFLEVEDLEKIAPQLLLDL